MARPRADRRLLAVCSILVPGGIGAFTEMTPSKNLYWLSSLDCPAAPRPTGDDVGSEADPPLPRPPLRTFDGSVSPTAGPFHVELPLSEVVVP